MKLDPILGEIRRVREAYASQFNGDIRAMMEDIRRRQKESGRAIVAREPKRIEELQESGPATSMER